MCGDHHTLHTRSRPAKQILFSVKTISSDNTAQQQQSLKKESKKPWKLLGIEKNNEILNTVAGDGEEDRPG
jgi:phosphotransferase system HPr-like phosphotransfer protein